MGECEPAAKNVKEVRFYQPSLILQYFKYIFYCIVDVHSTAKEDEQTAAVVPPPLTPKDTAEPTGATEDPVTIEEPFASKHKKAEKKKRETKLKQPEVEVDSSYLSKKKKKRKISINNDDDAEAIVTMEAHGNNHHDDDNDSLPFAKMVKANSHLQLQSAAAMSSDDDEDIIIVAQKK